MHADLIDGEVHLIGRRGLEVKVEDLWPPEQD
jgi:hypothetical protein